MHVSSSLVPRLSNLLNPRFSVRNIEKLMRAVGTRMSKSMDQIFDSFSRDKETMCMAFNAIQYNTANF